MDTLFAGGDVVFLEGVDAAALPEIVRNVLLYAALELASLAALSVLVWRRLSVSLTHQLAFVLDRQSVNVQRKLVSWVIFVLQTSLVQLVVGSDYSFAFEWLHGDTSTTHQAVTS